ncbi:EutP/PduV family microcompartment system protein [Enterococcus xiangfangensis]|uniref:EutP/PduV family microcompartment system protein n=1 Tax=Enterococcus xiangfangensis TaxID=1296537 RepID=UPI003D16D1C9|nr:EutP/PduV family microcompartment system protein [Enterococcus asini]
MRKIILMGAIGCGKTTLCQALNGDNLSYNKTQAVSYYTDIIDTPGEFVLHRQYYSALSVSAADAQVIGLVQSVTELEQVFSPGFASMFPKQVVGIVSKTDLAKDAKQMSYISEVPVSNAKKNHSTIKADNIPIAKKQKKTTKNKKDWDFAGDSYTPNDDSSKAGGHSSNADKGHGHTNVAIISEIVASILVIAGGIFWYVKKFHVGGQSK